MAEVGRFRKDTVVPSSSLQPPASRLGKTQRAEVLSKAQADRVKSRRDSQKQKIRRRHLWLQSEIFEYREAESRRCFGNGFRSAPLRYSKLMLCRMIPIEASLHSDCQEVGCERMCRPFLAMQSEVSVAHNLRWTFRKPSGPPSRNR